MKLVIEQERRRHRIDWFKVLCLFVLFALPISIAYQFSVHHLVALPTMAMSPPSAQPPQQSLD